MLRPHCGAHPVILGLPRGGVIVAVEVARALCADLDVVVVRKVGAPGSEEFALGAIAEGGAVWLNHEGMTATGLGEHQVLHLAEREATELARRIRIYRRTRPALDLAGRTAVVVDDGVATGATAIAAARSARLRGAARVILGAPVIAAASVPALRREFDEVVAVERPDPFRAVGEWYERFEQVSDEEVLASLHRGGSVHRRVLRVPVEGGGEESHAVEAELAVPERPRGLVALVHGSGSGRRSPRNTRVADELRAAGFATLLVDLLTAEEAAKGEGSPVAGDVPRLAARVAAAVRIAIAQPEARGLGVGLVGSSTGGAVALACAAEHPHLVAAVVCRGGRPDLLPPGLLATVHAPVLLLVGSLDEEVMRHNRAAMRHLPAAQLAVVHGATHLFEEPGALEAVSRLACGWFAGRLQEFTPGVAGAHGAA
ncbi:MAG TPA: alpha/beta family hydrolase [Anaeromyxobacteraceae bacterium]|nr:alpha/beta family hydrolase [Anaeromyxobacteraceae bacterium]